MEDPLKLQPLEVVVEAASMLIRQHYQEQVCSQVLVAMYFLYSCYDC